MSINYLAILGSTIASIVIGSIWYGPLFGKMFMREMGMDTWSKERQEKEKKRMGMAYFLQFVASLLMFYVLSKFTVSFGQMDVSGGVSTALWCWLGFVVPLALGNAVWGGNMKLFWLNIGNMFFTLLAAGAIIGALG